MKTGWIRWVSLLGLLFRLPVFAFDLDKSTLTIGVCEAQQLHGGDPKAVLRWESSDPQIAVVLQDGYVIGVKPGEARIVTSSDRSGSAGCAVTVKLIEPPMVDPSTLQQYPDSRKFNVDGRLCYGSELNGSRSSTPDEHKNLVSNRVINPKASSDLKLEWQLETGTEVYDGAGVLMGTVPVNAKAGFPTSKFNFGMSKVLHGRICLYAFSVSVMPTDALRRQINSGNLNKTGDTATSAWLPLDRVVDKETLVERIGLGKVKLPRLPLEETKYRITGGDPNLYVKEHGELSIVKSIDGPVPSHYLRRPSGTVNIVYSVPGFGLGGQGLDSFLVSDGIVFRPAKGAKAFVQPTYYPKGDPKAGQVAPMTQTFLYGAAIVEGNEPVYGWVAKEALQEMR